MYETLYTSPVQPDLANARDVLAFLLVPASAFIAPGDDAEQLWAVRNALDLAKRDALLDWYRHHTQARSE